MVSRFSSVVVVIRVNIMCGLMWGVSSVVVGS